MSKGTRRLLGCAAALPILLMPAAATAHEQAAAPPQVADDPVAQATPDQDPNQVGEIVVTAKRRAENLQRVPIVVTAVSGQQLTNAGVTSLPTLSTIAPGLNARTSGGGVFQPSIRGVGTSSNVVENPVALYIDGVYLPNQNEGNRELPDLTRISLPATGDGVRRGSFRMLFAGDFAIVTPLLWFCQAANQMANFFALTWLPTLLQAGGAGTAHAGASASLFSLGGLLSGVVLLLILDGVGVIPVVVLFLIGAPLVAGMALTELSPGMHALIIFGAGVCVTGVQIGLTALLGIFYPTAIRSSGTGWTQAAGRVGALAAPVVGGILLGLGHPDAKPAARPRSADGAGHGGLRGAGVALRPAVRRDPTW